MSEFAGGDGTENAPYQIEDWHHLNNVRLHSGCYFLQIADMDIGTEGYSDYNTDLGWLPIGENNEGFVLNYDGSFHKIKDLFINRENSDYVGLFGVLDGNGSVIEKVKVLDADITGDGNVGVMLGRLNHSNNVVKYCHTSGEVKGSDIVGGFLGGLDDGLVKECRSDANAVASTRAGGFAGWAYGHTDLTTKVENSYSTGNADATSNRAGGFIGHVAHHYEIEKVYSIGTATTDHASEGGLFGYAQNGVYFIKSFWDEQVSGNDTAGLDAGDNADIDVEGLTTAQAQAITKYETAGWSIAKLGDYIDEIWGINDGHDYPRLWWELDIEDNQLKVWTGTEFELMPYKVWDGTEWRADLPAKFFDGTEHKPIQYS